MKSGLVLSRSDIPSFYYVLSTAFKSEAVSTGD
jgi:hypothetical protein